MEWMLLPLKRYAQFRGRSRRMEYWMWILFTLIVTFVLSMIDSILGLGGGSSAGSTVSPNGFSYGAGVHGGLLANLFALGTLVPSLAVTVRRLHDTNRSGWWIVAPLVPYAVGAGLFAVGMMGSSTLAMILGGIVMFGGFVSAIVLLVWMCLKGTDGPNDYGDDPFGHSPEDLGRTFE